MTDPDDGAVCPICKSKAKLLEKTGDATGFRCPRHGNFRVADTIFALPSIMGAGTEQWEAALKRAKEHTVPGRGWPLITQYDF